MKIIYGENTVATENNKVIEIRWILYEDSQGEMVLSFGFPIEYTYERLKQLLPIDKPFCLHMGRNLCIDSKRMNKIMDRAERAIVLQKFNQLNLSSTK